MTILPMSFAGKPARPAKPAGMVQYFYSSPDSELPVRDVANKQGAGFKTEPHLENGSENFLKACTQNNIRYAINNGVDTLFLVTRCANRALKDFFGKQYIVGYLRIKEVIPRENSEGREFFAVRGDTRIVSYKDAIPVLDEFDAHFSRPRINSHGKLDARQTARLRRRLDRKPNIINACIREIVRLDTAGKTCIGQACEFAKQCLRFRLENESPAA